MRTDYLPSLSNSTILSLCRSLSLICTHIFQTCFSLPSSDKYRGISEEHRRFWITSKTRVIISAYQENRGHSVQHDLWSLRDPSLDIWGGGGGGTRVFVDCKNENIRSCCMPFLLCMLPFAGLFRATPILATNFFVCPHIQQTFF